MIGGLLPATPLAHTLGFSPLPGAFFATLVGMVLTYLVLIELGKRIFYRTTRTSIVTAQRRYDHTRHVAHRAARFTKGN